MMTRMMKHSYVAKIFHAELSPHKAYAGIPAMPLPTTCSILSLQWQLQ